MVFLTMNIGNELQFFFYSRDLFDLQDSNSEGTKENAGSQRNAHSNSYKIFMCTKFNHRETKDSYQDLRAEC
jgi:hypothetical protein